MYLFIGHKSKMWGSIPAKGLKIVFSSFILYWSWHKKLGIILVYYTF